MSVTETSELPKPPEKAATPELKALPPPPTMQQHMRAAMSWERSDIESLHGLLRDMGRIFVFLLPLLIPGLAAFIWRDKVSGWVEASPKSSWLALAASVAVIWLQVRAVPRSKVAEAWGRLLVSGRELFDYALLNRFGLVCFVAQAVTFLLVPQGIETLRTQYEHGRFDLDYYYRMVFFWMSLALLAFSQWYCARQLLIDHRYKGGQVSPLFINLPRLLGVGVPLVMALALHQASYAYWHDAPEWTSWIGPLPLALVLLAGPGLMPVTLAVLTVFYGVLYGICGFLLTGSPAFGSSWHTLNYQALSCVAAAWALSLFFSARHLWLEYQGESLGVTTEKTLVPPEETVVNRWDRFARNFFDRCLAPRRYFFSAVLFAVLIVLVLLFPVIPKTLGSAGLFLFAAGTFTRIGATLSHLAEKKGVPIFSMLLGGLVLFGLINDNHPVRQMRDRKIPAPLAPTLSLFAAQWLNDALDRCDDVGQNEVLPVFLFAAEGGGIRAAYWTASVLSGLQDRHPCLASRTLALSGVSGGAVGSAVFAAQVAQRKAEAEKLARTSAESPAQSPVQSAVQSDQDATTELFCRDFDGQKRAGYLACSRAILGDDFLAPALGTMLYPDLVQRFLPFPVAYFDRGTALEKGFERSYRRTMKNPLFEAPFDTLWRMTESPGDVPALFLNGTWVETGWRIIASPVESGPGERAAAEDLRHFVDHPIRLSTAAHLSARFTYLSPAGTLHRDGRISGHVVDGGYFENSGAATLTEILSALRDTLEQVDYVWTDRHRRNFRVAPQVGIIRFEEPPKRGRRDFGDLMAPPPQTVLVETSAPLRTLLQTRGARGDQSVQALTSQVERMRMQQADGAKSHVFTFTLRNEGASLPLGWSLSSAAKEDIAAQLERLLDSSQVGRDFKMLMQ